MPDILGSVGDVVRIFVTVKDSLKRIEQDLNALRTDMSTLRIDHSELKVRVAVLEEGRKVVEAQVRAVVAETIADLTIRFSRSQGTAQSLPQLSEPARESSESKE